MGRIFVISLVLVSSVSFASATYGLHCFGDKMATDMGEAKLELTTNLTINENNNYEIEGGNFYFRLMEVDYGEADAWTVQTGKVKLTKNKNDYRPIVHKNYAKFGAIADISGTVDLLIPRKVLDTPIQKFEAIFILTSIDDHWGGSLTAQCSMK